MRQAARRADLLVLIGTVGSFAEGTTARGICAGPHPRSRIPRYPAVTGTSPPTVPRRWRAHSWDNRWTAFRPRSSSRLSTSAPASGSRSRHSSAGGEPRGRPSSAGRTAEPATSWSGCRVSGDGRSGEDRARRVIVAGRRTASWLLGGADSARGVARVARPVVENGRPIVFEWVGSGSPGPTPINWTGGKAPGQRHAPVRRIRPGNGVARSWVVSLPSRQWRVRNGRGRTVLGGVSAASGRALGARIAGGHAIESPVGAGLAPALRALRARARRRVACAPATGAALTGV